MVAGRVEPQKAFVMVMPRDWQRIQSGEPGVLGSWIPAAANGRRPVARDRGCAAEAPNAWSRILVLGAGALVMEGKMLLPIKRLAETES